MNVTLTGEYKPTSQELANEIWNMPVFDQVELLYCLANIADKPAMYRQMSFINDELKRGFAIFGKKLQGFDSPYAVMTAVESRTSSPIRLLRNEYGVAIGHDSIYPCGEGAGYAGGITSAGVDGVRVAMALMKRFAPLEK